MAYKNILMIDDDEDDQEIFLAAVKKLSGAVIFNGLFDATEGLKKLNAKEITPDVIFLDLNMPVMNGQQFLKEIKQSEQLGNIPVIIFSTSDHLGTIQLMKEMGAHDFLTKPRSFDILVDILRPLIS